MPDMLEAGVDRADGSGGAGPIRDRPSPEAVGGLLVDAVCTVIDGKRDAVALAVTVLLAEGHLLIEDVPGVGKTMLARALARTIGGSSSRIQFTPDLLPSDVTGVSVYDQAKRDFEFKPGAVFANVVIADEINRASPKTQSALLECMAEAQVTVDGRTWAMPEPFLVVATQNPIDMDGTYALPEAQRDRFAARISMGYPSKAAERDMLRAHDRSSPIASLGPTVTVHDVAAAVAAARRVFVSPAVEGYVLAIVAETRRHPDLRLGASPRATLQLIRVAKARALLEGRDFVLPDDIDAVAAPVLAHRLVVAPAATVRSAAAESEAATAIIAEIVATTAVPNG